MSRIREIEKFTRAKIQMMPKPDEEALAFAVMERMVFELRDILKSGAKKELSQMTNLLHDDGYSYEEIANAIAQRLILPKADKKKERRTGAKMTTLIFNIGSNFEINAGHIVAAIARTGGLPGEVIGRISVGETETKADIPTLFTQDVLPKLENLKIRGKRVTVKVQ